MLLWEREEAPTWRFDRKVYWPKASTCQTYTNKLRGLVNLDCHFWRWGTIKLARQTCQPIFSAVKIPDFFYINQASALNKIHDRSVEISTKLYRHNNPTNAYDSEFGEKWIAHLEAEINNSYPSLDGLVISRILLKRLKPPGFGQRPELDHDILRMETIQANIEHELTRLHQQKMVLIAWLQAGIAGAIATGLLWWLIL